MELQGETLPAFADLGVVTGFPQQGQHTVQMGNRKQAESLMKMPVSPLGSWQSV